MDNLMICDKSGVIATGVFGFGEAQHDQSAYGGGKRVRLRE